MNMIDLYDARALAIGAAEAAGGLVREKLFRSLAIREKDASGDVVTDLDIAAEKIIVGTIRAQFPEHRIISEEIGKIGGDRAWTWLIDPVDGTNNVVVGLPVLAIGITLCHNDAAVASVVHDPVSRRTWSAIHQKGAWGADGCRMGMGQRRAESRHKPVLAWIQGYGVASSDPQARALKLVLASEARRVLDLWAPLTCWMMLARGDIDGIVGYRIGELDLHGGALIASETGLTVQTFSGAPFEPRLRGGGEKQCVIAGSETVVKELSDMLDSAKRIAGPLSAAVSAGLLPPGRRAPTAARQAREKSATQGEQC
jgi:myo-inositol-1(or 4)-monophosphatase